MPEFKLFENLKNFSSKRLKITEPWTDPCESEDDNTPKKNKRFIIAVSIILVCIFLLNLIFSFKKLKENLAYITTPTFPENQPIKNQDIEDQNPNAAQCSYEDLIVEHINKPSDSDNIQKNIGYQNNKFGLYVYAEVSDYIDKADELANSNGGEWGYVLIPYNVKDRNLDRWSHVFELLYEKKLIPIIQLWDLDIDDEEEELKQIKGSAKFLNSLKWPITKKYISAYNEVNDAKFWKGKIDPEGYATVLNTTIEEFKKLDKDFFIMNGAFNASARTGGDYLDARTFMRRMHKQMPGIFTRLDGWASHPYPQPNFTGSPKATGRDSIRAYEWELEILKEDFDVNTDRLPVFITETGWPHKEGENDNRSYLDKYKTADYIKEAFENVWLKDDRIVAVTPFTVRYDEPFDHFSWITKEGNNYPQFDAVKSIKKVKGNPPYVEYSVEKRLVCE
ncbi:MAG: hypothetical protein E6Q58_05380 [Niabella sp.]|nr:MAG: hypothetical protein E6Q58_05380 [Niabella sp.]